jgi:ornithine cyclodeaminase/alanine dehydrogenase-like protein (mu-crystallin family)
MEGGFLTDLRTGAGTALAARYLARPNSECLALIGAGRVARNQLEALAASFDGIAHPVPADFTSSGL